MSISLRFRVPGRLPSLLAIAAFATACASSSGGTEGKVPPATGVVAEGPLDPDTQKSFLSQPGSKTEIRVTPPAGAAAFTFVIDETRPVGKGTAYFGHVAGAPGSSGTVFVAESTIAGTIRIPGRGIYVLGSRAGGRPVVRAADPAKLPPDHPPGYGLGGREGPKKPAGPVGNVGDT